MALTIREYLAPDGRSPFRDWLAGLDVTARARVQARILRFQMGNFGDHKVVGDGVWEARLAFGPGYRLYFGRSGQTVMLLLLGGDKGSQARDIDRAKKHWATYMKESKHGKAK